MNFEFQGHRVHDFQLSEQTLAKPFAKSQLEAVGLLHGGGI